jgi:hypothetical protein
MKLSNLARRSADADADADADEVRRSVAIGEKPLR